MSCRPLSDPVVDWLMDGDPAIRWQVMRDLRDCPETHWKQERSRVTSEGWGGRLLDFQDASGTWGGGIYSPKWTSTTYTLLTLIDFGLDPENLAARRGAEQVFDSMMGQVNLRKCDTCVYGFYLHITAYFGFSGPLMDELCETLLNDQMDDGGWNCRRWRVKNVCHSSFHTTFNVLEGLREAARRGLVDSARFSAAEAKAMEFMLQHRMYKSDKTGEVINEHFTEISYPPRWHYDVLRGLDYIRETRFVSDQRLEDAIVLLNSKVRDGFWPAQNKHPGKTFFTLEPMARNRSNTLRALRVLKKCRQRLG